jgi:NAD(P)H-hydrate epimerase
VPLEQLRLLEQMGASVYVGAGGMLPAELSIDGIFGYGQRGDPRPEVGELIAATLGARVLWLDAPSGVELKRGTVGEPAVHAESTLTLALPKAALRFEVARPLMGELCMAGISIPAVVYERLDIPYRSPFSRRPIVRLV